MYMAFVIYDMEWEKESIETLYKYWKSKNMDWIWREQKGLYQNSLISPNTLKIPDTSNTLTEMKHVKLLSYPLKIRRNKLLEEIYQFDLPKKEKMRKLR